MMKNDPFYLLLKRYTDGECNEEESILVEDWYYHFNEDQARAVISEEDFTGVEQRVGTKLGIYSNRKFFSFNKRAIAVAASLLVILSLGIYFLTGQHQHQFVATSHGILPGSDKAMLKLADGSEIDLSEKSSGSIADEGHVIIGKHFQGELKMRMQPDFHNNTADQNMLVIPKGGKYKISLNDGTLVWLNSFSSLKFPTAFSGHNREVELTGEAYFEVAKDASHPFVVKTLKQRIEVLGTHFNVNAYNDESITQTTLLEGRVKINNSTFLSPGQSGSGSDQHIQIQTADTEKAIAWKEGLFVFDGNSLASIMRQISRWYNVDVQFKTDELKDITFSGTVSRSVALETILKRLKLTKEVDFEIRDGNIFVKNYK